MINNEERQVLGKYYSMKANLLRQELEVLDELLNDLGKPFTEEMKSEKPTEANFNALNWNLKEGNKGSYEQVESDGSENFRALAKYVQKKGGFCNIYGFKTWLHNNDDKRIDRKK